MAKKLVLLLALISIGIAHATPIEITPVDKISTTTKSFAVGNKYRFKDIKNGDIYTGEVTYYRPNGMTGYEAQIEIGNFKNANGEIIPGEITVIPSNHTKLQEYSNHFVSTCPDLIRGSEVILLPEKHKFLINIDKISKNTGILELVPAQEISTAYDELECGDIIKFKTTKDLYLNDKLFIKEGSFVYGKIDFLDENGWIGDNAKIIIKEFFTQNDEGKELKFRSELEINGFELLKYKSKRTAQFFNYISSIVRGKEVDIKTYDTDVRFVIVVKE